MPLRKFPLVLSSEMATFELGAEPQIWWNVARYPIACRARTRTVASEVREEVVRILAVPVAKADLADHYTNCLSSSFVF